MKQPSHPLAWLGPQGSLWGAWPLNPGLVWQGAQGRCRNAELTTILRVALARKRVKDHE